ncbi:MAG TPA: Ig-like domain-containing protein [Candidatus Dormibacteraeota bacterium]|nr:Ig-like domain-containing protein [Candidatus Dormibacteraeota bacterium]
MAAGALLAAVLLTACGGDPPQIVDYAPQRNTIDVSTAAPLRIAFDHDVDRPSVELRLHLLPPTTGSVRWLSGRELVYDHATLRTNTTYEVILEPGYRDPAGNTYTLRHHWSFVTEGPPSLSGSSPANGDASVDPASFLNLDFTRQMDPATLKSAIAFSPGVPFDVRLDPADPHRAIIAPSQLLTASTAYQVLVNTAATDLDGNQLGRDEVVRFTTGPQHELRHWIAFATATRDGSPGGLWIVDERGFPRELFDASAVQSFNWSPAGDSLLIQGSDQSWWQLAPGATESILAFKAVWAAALTGGMGFVYLDPSSELHRQSADGADETIANDVVEAAVSPNGLRVAYVQGTSGSREIWGYDVGLRATYQLVLDTAPVSDIAWSPAGNRIAYLRHDVAATTLRVRNLTGAAATTTLTAGDIGRPAWLPDSTHLVFSAAVTDQGAVMHKAYIVNVVSPPTALTLAAGLPSDPAIQVSSPVSSPDGHQIAFLSGDQVWLMNADGTRPTALTKEDPASFPYSCRALAWTRS